MKPNCLRIVGILFSLFVNFTVNAQTLYQFYNAKGEKVDFKEVIEAVNEHDMVYFGELHNNPVAHWASLEIISSMNRGNGELWFGLEMFERDQQQTLNELNSNLIKVEDLHKYTRTWNNYSTDYAPLLKRAHERGFKVLGTNIPRQYASFVYKNGLDSLYTLDIPKDHLPPKNFIIDTSLTSYAALSDMAKSMGMGHRNNNFMAAQAIKDATMARFIIQKFRDGDKLFHLNGAYHTKNREGIIWYILQENTDVKILSIQSIESQDPNIYKKQEDNASDYYLFINKNVSKSYE